MAKDVHVYSTLTADQIYTVWAKAKGNDPLAHAEKRFFVKGGANLADKRLITPRGVLTTFSASDFADLKTIQAFKDHERNGFISWSESKADPEKVVADGMVSRDESAPMNPGDYDTQAPGEAKIVERAADPVAQQSVAPSNRRRP